MKVAVSIPDDLLERADKLARRLGISRSQLYREALVEYVARRDRDAVTGALDALADELAVRPDGWSPEAARLALTRDAW